MQTTLYHPCQLNWAAAALNLGLLLASVQSSAGSDYLPRALQVKFVTVKKITAFTHGESADFFILFLNKSSSFVFICKYFNKGYFFLLYESLEQLCYFSFEKQVKVNQQASQMKNSAQWRIEQTALEQKEIVF